ncbi:hypothetical protein MIR68_001277 [Amoeboaphelidium protococcarum]|nr:hypothetical protein MIR68_001277 [Amoeboaphelidium protococcarum]
MMMLKYLSLLILIQFVLAVDQLDQFLDAVDQEPARHNLLLQQNIGEQLIVLQPQNDFCITNYLLELIRNLRVSDQLYASFVGLVTSDAGRHIRAFVINAMKSLRQTRDVQWALQCVQGNTCRLPSFKRYVELLLAADSTSLALIQNQILPTILIMLALFIRYANPRLNVVIHLLVTSLYISFILLTQFITMKMDFLYHHNAFVIPVRLIQVSLVLNVIQFSEAMFDVGRRTYDIRRGRALGIPQGLFMRNNEVNYGCGTQLTRLSVNDHFVESHVLSAEDECLLCRNEFEASEIAKRPRCSRNIYLHNKCLCQWLITNPKCFICNTKDRYSEGPSGVKQFVEEQNAGQAQRQEFESLSRDEQTENTV